MKNFLTDNLFTCSLAQPSYSYMADGGMMSREDLRRNYSIGSEIVGSRRMYFIYNHETGQRSTKNFGTKTKYFKTEQEAQKSLNDALELLEAHIINKEKTKDIDSYLKFLKEYKEKKDAQRGNMADGGIMGKGGVTDMDDYYDNMTDGESRKKRKSPPKNTATKLDSSLIEKLKKLGLSDAEIKRLKIIKADGGMMARGGAVEQLESIKETNTITERQINLIKNRLNSGKSSPELREIVQYIWDNKPVLDAAQTKKGYDFLYSLWKSPTGKERANSPYGYREEDVLTNFLGFQLSGFWDVSRYGQKPFLVPLYIAEGVNNSFEYYYWGTKINIVG